MPTTTFNASSLRYYLNGGWTSGQARQGFVNNSAGNLAATRGEITFNFAGTVDVSNIDISQIVLRFTVGTQGGAYTKYLYLHTGSYNGASVGNYSFSSCYNTTKSKTFSASSNASGFEKLKAYIEGGGTKLGVYTGSSRGSGSGKSYDYDYMNITAMSLDITYTFKKSTGSISSASTGSAATLKITAYNSAYTHKLTWKLGSNSATTTAAAGATSASYTIPHGWLPNATSGTATVTLETLSGSTSLGSNTYSFIVRVPVSVVPSIGMFKAEPVNSGASSTAAGWGLYIQNKTKASLTVGSVAAGSGASISAYSITSSPNFGSASASSMTSNLLTASGSVTFTAKVTDSRGRTSEAKTVTITVQAYAAPQFTATPTIYRCLSNGTRDDIEGTYARLTASFSYSSVNSQNSLTVRKVVLNGVTTTLTSGTAVTIGAGALAVDSSYSAVITLTDAVGSTTTYTLTVPSATYVMHVRKGGKSVGIGRAASGSNNRIDSAWPVYFDGGGYGSVAGTSRQNIGVGFAIYRSVTQLGLTEGSATMLAAYSAMANGSVLAVRAAEFDGGEMPNNYGTVVIIKSADPARGFIFFFGKGTTHYDYRMGLASTTYNNNNSNLPTGEWVRVLNMASLKTVSPSLTFSSGYATYTFGSNVDVIGYHAVANAAPIVMSRTSGYTGYRFTNVGNSSYSGTLTVEIFYIER